MSNAYDITATLRSTIDELRIRLTAAETKVEILLEERNFKKEIWARIRRELTDAGLFLIGVLGTLILMTKLHLFH